MLPDIVLQFHDLSTENCSCTWQAWSQRSIFLFVIRVDIITQIPVRTKNYFLIFGKLSTICRALRSYNYIRYRFYCSRCVDVLEITVCPGCFDKLRNLSADNWSANEQLFPCRVPHFLCSTKHSSRCFTHKVNAAHRQMMSASVLPPIEPMPNCHRRNSAMSYFTLW